MRISGPKNELFIDIGSTIIKYFRFDGDGFVSDSGYFPRDYEKIVGKQVMELIDRDIGVQNYKGLKICSSANGGLKVGLFALTKEYSEAIAKRAISNAGANLAWSINAIDNYSYNEHEYVDVLIIACGMECIENEQHKKWIEPLKDIKLNAEVVIFSGNTALNSLISECVPSIITTNQLFKKNLNWNGERLVEVIRSLYLNDLVEKKGISQLNALSDSAIYPTPVIVQNAFDAIARNEVVSIQYPTPFLMIDVGGATTDVYFGQELAIESEKKQYIKRSNRHVFTNLGMSASCRSLLQELSLNEGLYDYLKAIQLNEMEPKELYSQIRDGLYRSPSNEFLALSCIYLALYKLINGDGKIDPIACRKMMAIVVTGGASQICKKSSITKVLSLFSMQSVQVELDTDYSIWIEGMSRVGLIGKEL